MTSLLETPPRVSILLPAPSPLLIPTDSWHGIQPISRPFPFSISSYISYFHSWIDSWSIIVRWNGDDEWRGPVAKRIERPRRSCFARDAHCSLRFASLRHPSISCSIDHDFSKLSARLGSARLGDRPFDIVAGKRIFIAVQTLSTSPRCL